MRAIDFGTSSTAAAQRVDGGAPELVTFQGDYAFPSCVAVHDGDLLCGNEAEALLPGDPAAGTRVPKLILAERGTAYLDGVTVAVEQIIAPILHEADGGDIRSAPGPRILTHPASWEPAGTHCAVLLDAAHRAGLDEVELVSEPEAVAWYVADRAGMPDTFAVFDLGGGTCDMAALQRVSDGFDLLARPRSETIGGELANTLLTELVLARLDEQRTDAADALRAAQRLQAGAHAASIDPEALVWLQRLIGLQAQVRVAKERLSTHERVLVRFPAPMRDVKIEITQSELADRMRPYLERAADALAAVLDEAGFEPPRTTVLVSGAASMMPCVAEILRERCGAAPTLIRPPKGAVALGALAALEARHAPRRRQPGAKPVDSPARDPERAQRVQATVTKLVQDADWEDLPEPVRAWLLDAVVGSTEDDDFGELIPKVAMLRGDHAGPDGDDASSDRIRTRIDPIEGSALVVTSARLLWVETGPRGEIVSSHVPLADATDVRPATSADAGLYGLHIRLPERWQTFVLSDLDEDTILDLLERIAEGLPAGAPRDGGAMLATLRKFIAARGYAASWDNIAASLLHAVATAKTPEEIHWVESCNNGMIRLVTTTERLIWTDETTELTRSARFAEIDRIGGLSSPDRGVHGFSITINDESHEFYLSRADLNVAYMRKQQGQTPKRWVLNVGKLRGFAGWADVETESQRWLEHALVGKDEELLYFAYCSYEDGDSWRGADALRTTALLLTSKRVLWARVGMFTGLSTREAPIAKLTKVEGFWFTDGLWLTIDGKRHGFAGFPEREMLDHLRRLRGS